MASVKLTNDMRGDIRGAAMKGAFETETQAMLQRRRAVGDAVYRLLVTEEQEKQMKKLPTGFFATDDSLHFTPYKDAASMSEGRAYRKYFQLTTDRRMPKFFDTYSLPVIVGAELMAEIIAVEQEEERLSGLAKDLKDRINGVLLSVGTVTRLLTIWPEVDGFLPDYAKNPKLSSLPAVMVEELNVILKAAKHEAVAP